MNPSIQIVSDAGMVIRSSKDIRRPEPKLWGVSCSSGGGGGGGGGGRLMSFIASILRDGRGGTQSESSSSHHKQNTPKDRRCLEVGSNGQSGCSALQRSHSRENGHCRCDREIDADVMIMILT